MIIDVQNTLHAAKNSVMTQFSLAVSTMMTMPIAFGLMSDSAAATDIFAWQAADGSSAFSDRPPQGLRYELVTSAHASWTEIKTSDAVSTQSDSSSADQRSANAVAIIPQPAVCRHP